MAFRTRLMVCLSLLMVATLLRTDQNALVNVNVEDGATVEAAVKDAANAEAAVREAADEQAAAAEIKAAKMEVSEVTFVDESVIAAVQESHPKECTDVSSEDKKKRCADKICESVNKKFCKQGDTTAFENKRHKFEMPAAFSCQRKYFCGDDRSTPVDGQSRCKDRKPAKLTCVAVGQAGGSWPKFLNYIMPGADKKVDKEVLKDKAAANDLKEVPVEKVTLDEPASAAVQESHTEDDVCKGDEKSCAEKVCESLNSDEKMKFCGPGSTIAFENKRHKFPKMPALFSCQRKYFCGDGSAEKGSTLVDNQSDCGKGKPATRTCVVIDERSLGAKLLSWLA